MNGGAIHLHVFLSGRNRFMVCSISTSAHTLGEKEEEVEKERRKDAKRRGGKKGEGKEKSRKWIEVEQEHTSYKVRCVRGNGLTREERMEGNPSTAGGREEDRDGPRWQSKVGDGHGTASRRHLS